MKINTRVCSAIRLMADIARNGASQPVSLREVAQRQSLSQVYLSQLAIPLRNASLLRSVWGNRGGYMLGHAAGDIKVLDIIEAVEGPVVLTDCVADPSTCPRTVTCECLPVWREMNDSILGALTKYSLEDLIRKERAPSKGGSHAHPGGPLAHAGPAAKRGEPAEKRR